MTLDLVRDVSAQLTVTWPKSRGLSLFVPMALTFMWDVFVGELGVVRGFFLKHLVTRGLSRHRNMDLEQLKWPQNQLLVGGHCHFPHAVFVIPASSMSDYFLGSCPPL